MSNYDKPLYCCFSVPQKDFLQSKGIKYEDENGQPLYWKYYENS